MISSPRGDNTLMQADLVPVNILITLCKRDKKWPNILYKCGYRVKAIEQAVAVSEEGRTLVDVILLNRKKNHAIAWECKSGRGVNEKQARVYSRITAKEIQETGNVSFRSPESATAESAYCCLEEHAANITLVLKRFGNELPVLAVGKTLSLAKSGFVDLSLQKEIQKGILLPPLEEVPRYLPADTHTSKHELARHLFAALVVLLRKQVERVSLRRLLTEAFCLWECMGLDVRRYIAGTAKDILTELCSSELKDYARAIRVPQNPDELNIEFHGVVIGQDASRRTRSFQKLQRLAQKYVERTKANLPYEPEEDTEKSQMSLFPET